MKIFNNEFKSIVLCIALTILSLFGIFNLESYESKVVLSTSKYIAVTGDTTYDIDGFFDESDVINSMPIIIVTLLFVLLPILGEIIFWYFIIKLIVNAFRRSTNHKYFKNNVVSNDPFDTDTAKRKSNKYVDVNNADLATFQTDNIDSLKQDLYNNFVKFETAYNNLDYNTMKILATKQLYNNYHTGITLDLKVGKKRIIEDIKKKKVVLYELDSTIAKQIVSVMIEVSYINYVIDKNGNVISGNRINPINEKFEVTFRKDFERNNITKCPNCGANITGNKCEYCRSTINDIEFKISNIKKIID